MPEHLRALSVILAIAVAIFMAVKRPACAAAMRPADFARRRNLWFGLTLAAFLSHSFWIYIALSAVMLALAAPREKNKLAMFFFVLLAVPMITDRIGGLGFIQHFVAINNVRLLGLVVLLPAYVVLRKQSGVLPFGRVAADWFLVAYVLLNLGLQVTVDSFTNTMRSGVYAAVDIFLPYYIASRSLRTLADFKDVAMALVVAASIVATVAVFEFGKGWLLYSSLDRALNVPSDWSDYLRRGEALRAMASTTHPIVLGYVLTVSVGFFLFLLDSIGRRSDRILLLLVLLTGLAATVSRGPWVGAAVLLAAFIVTGPQAVARLTLLGGAGALAFAGLLATPAGDALIEYLPFVGSVGAETISYRQRLLEYSIAVVLRNPVFGSFDYLYTPEMQALRQGQGIIDIVNSYVGIALKSGFVGLFLFVAFFSSVLLGIVGGTRIADRRNEDAWLRLGRSLLATLLAILVVIFTVSSIGVIPVLYWTIAGIGVAYVACLTKADAATEATRTRRRDPRALGVVPLASRRTHRTPSPPTPVGGQR